MGLLALKWALVCLVLIGAVPLVVATYQFLLVGVHFLRLHYRRCGPYYPRTVILIPAWNEALVIETSVDRLMQLNYPAGRLRVYVIDDASTDETPELLRGQGTAVSGPGVPPAPRGRRAGQGAHPELRA